MDYVSDEIKHKKYRRPRERGFEKGKKQKKKKIKLPRNEKLKTHRRHDKLRRERETGWDRRV